VAALAKGSKKAAVLEDGADAETRAIEEAVKSIDDEAVKSIDADTGECAYVAS
jgi:hypothetical protein